MPSCNVLTPNVSSSSPTASPQLTWRSPSNAGCVSWCPSMPAPIPTGSSIACIGCSAARSSTAPTSFSKSGRLSIVWLNACWTSIAASVVPTSSARSSATASPKPTVVVSRRRSPTITASGRRTPGLKLDDPRLLAVMQALTCFVHLARGGRFRTRDLHQRAAEALGLTTDTYRLSQLRYDLAKLRAKGLVLKVPKTQTYRLSPQGTRICILFLKLFHRVYAPLRAGILKPLAHDAVLPDDRRCELDHLYAAVDRALNQLLDHLGFTTAA